MRQGIRGHGWWYAHSHPNSYSFKTYTKVLYMSPALSISYPSQSTSVAEAAILLPVTMLPHATSPLALSVPEPCSPKFKGCPQSL